VTVTVGPTGQVVLAWGGHISARWDWGVGNSAVSISGGPFHVEVDGHNANIKASDIDPSARIIIIVTSSPTTNTAFPFTATNFEAANFSLIPDNNNLIDRYISAPITNFGAANGITVRESLVAAWSLAGITCTSTVNNNNTIDFPNRQATIVVEAGELVVCTFANVQAGPTAAPVSVSGRVVDGFGQGIRNARIVVTSSTDGTSRSALSNPFGYYTVTDLSVNDFYVVRASHKQFTFTDDTRSFSLTDNIADVDFIANP